MISAVSARDRGRNRDADLSGYAWEDDPVALARREDVDVLIEVIGGHEGVARAATEAAITAGKDVVTANKALFAHHGQALAEAAEARGRVIRFEAAVAGGIPVVKALTEGLAANRITRVMGVMNGTCNYILTRMESAGLPYATVFEEARQLGYLEADPELDVGGIDAAHKLSLLAAMAFGTRVAFDAVELRGDRPDLDRRHPPRRRHGLPDQASGGGADDRARAGTADEPLPGAVRQPAWPVAGRHQHGGAGGRRGRPDRAARRRRRRRADRLGGDGRRDRRSPVARGSRPSASRPRP